jgi:hypothetical protein
MSVADRRGGSQGPAWWPCAHSRARGGRRGAHVRGGGSVPRSMSFRTGPVGQLSVAGARQFGLQDRCEGGAGGDEVAVAEVPGAAVDAGEGAAGLADQEGAGGDVPGLEVILPVGVEAARGEVGEVEGGRAGAADAADLGDDAVELEEVVGRAGGAGVGEAGGDEGEAEGAGGGDVEGRWLAVAGAGARGVDEGAVAAEGKKGLVSRRVMDDAEAGAVVIDEGDGDAEVGEAVGEVGGAVERVDDPLEDAGRGSGVGAGVAGDPAGLLGEDPVGRGRRR